MEPEGVFSAWTCNILITITKEVGCMWMRRLPPWLYAQLHDNTDSNYIHQTELMR